MRSTYPVGGGRPPLSFGESMRLIVPALISVLLCGCGRETHVRNKVYSVLPQIEQDIAEGGVEQVPDAILAQLKDGGRIGAIFMEGAVGTARVGYKAGGKVTWRSMFNASAPVLAGFRTSRGFTL